MLTISSVPSSESAVEFGILGSADKDRIRLSATGNATVQVLQVEIDLATNVGYADLTSGAIELGLDDLVATSTEAWPAEALSRAVLGARGNFSGTGKGKVYAAFWTSRSLTAAEKARAVNLVGSAV